MGRHHRRRHHRRRHHKKKGGWTFFIIIILLAGLVWAYSEGHISLGSIGGVGYCENNIKLEEVSFANINNFYPLVKYSSKSCWRTCEGSSCVTEGCINTQKLTWKDGTQIDIPASKIHTHFGIGTPTIDSLCRMGSKQGENKNYLYCEDFGYKKTIIGNDGSIGTTHYYMVDIVLDFSETTREEFLTTPESDHKVSHFVYDIKQFKCSRIGQSKYEEVFTKIEIFD